MLIKHFKNSKDRVNSFTMMNFPQMMNHFQDLMEDYQIGSL